MTQVSSHQLEADLVDLVPPRKMLPGEDKGAYDALRDALLSDLAPATPYQRVLAENLVSLEWEAVRYRNLRDDLLIQRARDAAANVIDDPAGIIKFDISEDSKRAAISLFGPDGAEREASKKLLEKAGTNVGEVLAKAYTAEITSLDHFARHIAEIETRRRRLLDDYERLKSTRRPPIPDAEIIENDDD